MRWSGSLSDVPLPGHWPQQIKSALLHAIALAHTALTCSRSWAANSSLKRVQLAGELDEARVEIALLREELRIKDTRLAKIAPRHRPYYPATERLAILELRAARGWNLAQTAKIFFIESETVASWMSRLTEESDALLRLSEPVNKLPDFVRYLVQRLKTLCPLMGKRRIAQVLARAGLQLSATTAWRLLRQQPNRPQPEAAVEEAASSMRVVTARYPNHVWLCDLTTVPCGGFWTPWFPFTLPQVWPFCWWVAVLLDHYSRALIGFAVFPKPPAAADLQAMLVKAIRRVGQQPRHLISDQGKQFTAEEFCNWCRLKGIKQRFGAVGKYGSIALIERFIRSLKQEAIAQIIIPLRFSEVRRELSVYATWYNQHRPHQALAGSVPLEVYHGITAAPPPADPRTPGAKPLQLHISYLEQRKHLPIVELKEAA